MTTGPPIRPKGHLLRIFGVGFGIAVIIGGVIGSGHPAHAGFGCSPIKEVTELGTVLPRAGGWYVYPPRVRRLRWILSRVHGLDHERSRNRISGGCVWGFRD